MNKVKAGQIMEILVNLDFTPTLDKLPDGSYKITIGATSGMLFNVLRNSSDSTDGIPINILKSFQDNNNVILKAKIIEII